MKKIYPLILCGGSGTRLWPLSRTRSPKQFQKIGGKNSLTFFQTAIQRHRGERFHEPCIVTNLRHRGTVVSQLREIQSGSQIICEPMGRNTGPAVLAAAHAMNSRDPNAIILVIPADHVIEGDINETIFSQVDAVADGQIVTFGIAPRGPETGFGYVVRGEELADHPGLHKVEQFIEKPPLQQAEELVAGGNASWASGISMFSARSIIEEYEKHDPETAANVKKSVMGASLFPEALYLDADGFSQTKAEPTEKAVFEKTDRIATVSLDVTWSDVGSWAAMYDISAPDKDGNVFQGDVVAVNSKNTLVRSESRLVSVVGVSDIIVVDTSDAILITRRNKSQHVKEVVEILKKNSRSEAEHNVGAAPKMIPFSAPKVQEQILQTDNFQLGTSQIPVGGCIDMEDGHGKQVIVVNGSVHAQGPGWQKTVREGGRIYSDPEGSIRITNCEDVETELLFMAFDVGVESPKSVPMAGHA
ncbi:mannose-1-phosphate guanylyltransferase [Aliiroseovarius sp. YM-037]|uniref:mannose-1-phosphate guanylyltransferase n=1 Tax=Aliiroseovarius sp. YM-037 TaxID=3341728 RepID=UPI003A8021D0